MSASFCVGESIEACRIQKIINVIPGLKSSMKMQEKLDKVDELTRKRDKFLEKNDKKLMKLHTEAKRLEAQRDEEINVAKKAMESSEGL